MSNQYVIQMIPKLCSFCDKISSYTIFFLQKLLSLLMKFVEKINREDQMVIWNKNSTMIQMGAQLDKGSLMDLINYYHQIFYSL